MVQIKVKGLKATYHVIAHFDDFEAFITQLKERLKACQRGNSRSFEAFFHVDEMDDEQCLRFMRACGEEHTLILGINYVKKEKKPIIIEQSLYNGQSYTFDEPIILLGNISSQAYVNCKEDLYVIGSVYGTLDFHHKHCVLAASQIDANVRICDSSYQKMTSFASSKVYYENRHLKLMEYKEEKKWQR